VASVFVAHTATPETTGCEAHPEMKLPSLVNATLPVAMPPAPLTLAVNVTLAPTSDGFDEDARLVADTDIAWNDADTEIAPFIVNVQLPAPEQAPPQPARLLPLAGAADSVTAVPELKVALHVLPQAMPAGWLVTVPLPDVETVSVLGIVPLVVKVAVMVCGAFNVTEQLPVPAQPPPLQPPKAEPDAAVAVSVTVVPLV
jgi:hypothetical protein